uniref:CAAX prenyl protease n=1 Tax=Rhodnius prolixus TaxID=13249 RepID=R4G4J9_RHOPR
MNESDIFGSILIISWIEFLWELYLSVRQHKVYTKTTTLPIALQNAISEETFLKSRVYALDKSNYSIFKSIYAMIIGTATLWFFVIFHIWQQSKALLALVNITEGEMKISAVFIILMFTLNVIISLPLSVYETFVLEEKHGFNKQTAWFFIKDKIKSFIVSTIIMVPLVCGIIYIVKAGGDFFFIYLWLFSMVTLLFLMTVYPDYIAPLFDKYTPLPEGELKTKIEELAASVNFPLYKLYLVEGSKRSVHSNAYFYGFFKNKRIVLFDTLLKSHSNEGEKGCDTEEILAILAHELGHWKFNHVTKNIVIMQINLFLQFFAFGLLFKYPQLYRAFGFMDEQPIIIGIVIVMLFVFSPYNSIMSLFLTILSRKYEFQADGFAKTLGKSESLRKALIKLNQDNLSFPVYDWLFSAWHHSHPPLLQRLEYLKKED